MTGHTRREARTMKQRSVRTPAGEATSIRSGNSGGATQTSHAGARLLRVGGIRGCGGGATDIVEQLHSSTHSI